MKTGRFSAKKETTMVAGVSNAERHPNIWFIVKRCVKSEFARPLGRRFSAIGRHNQPSLR
jgi:hypothetical protein